MAAGQRTVGGWLSTTTTLKVQAALFWNHIRQQKGARRGVSQGQQDAGAARVAAGALTPAGSVAVAVTLVVPMGKFAGGTHRRRGKNREDQVPRELLHSFPTGWRALTPAVLGVGEGGSASGVGGLGLERGGGVVLVGHGVERDCARASTAAAGERKQGGGTPWVLAGQETAPHRWF